MPYFFKDCMINLFSFSKVLGLKYCRIRETRSIELPTYCSPVNLLVRIYTPANFLFELYFWHPPCWKRAGCWTPNFPWAVGPQGKLGLWDLLQPPAAIASSKDDAALAGVCFSHFTPSSVAVLPCLQGSSVADSPLLLDCPAMMPVGIIARAWELQFHPLDIPKEWPGGRTRQPTLVRGKSPRPQGPWDHVG